MPNWTVLLITINTHQVPDAAGHYRQRFGTFLNTDVRSNAFVQAVLQGGFVNPAAGRVLRVDFPGGVAGVEQGPRHRQLHAHFHIRFRHTGSPWMLDGIVNRLKRWVDGVLTQQQGWPGSCYVDVKLHHSGRFLNYQEKQGAVPVLHPIV